MRTNGKDNPDAHCKPIGVVQLHTHPYPRRIIQTPGMVAILYEAYNHWRQIFLDGRPLPQTVQPAYLGYSVGKWDGDTLVVDTTGFNDRGWLDDGGHPQTESLHVTERFRRSSFGHVDLQITIDDPKAYTKPWSALLHYTLLPDTELIEFVCDNEKDVPHLVGK